MSFMYLQQPATGRIFRVEPATASVWVWNCETCSWWSLVGNLGSRQISEHPVIAATELPGWGKL